MSRWTEHDEKMAEAGMLGRILIEAERRRQIATGGEGWTAAHDDEHASGELMRAAMAYIKVTHHPDRYTETPPDNWPWGSVWWKPSDDAVRNLVKAGALIAAEIDRLVRADAADREATS